MPGLLTLFLGPQTALALSLNGVIRAHRAALAAEGLHAVPSRLATPGLRKNLDGRPFPERQQEFAKVRGAGAAFLSAVHFLGGPEAGFHQGELFPDVEALLAGLHDLAGDARLLLAVDTLPAFFAAAESEALAGRVRETPWEALYDLGWVDLARELLRAMPGSDLVVLTPRNAAIHSGAVLGALFGRAARALPDPQVLLREAISDTGRAVVARMTGEGGITGNMASELYDSFAVRPGRDEIRERFGIDPVTSDLLEDRFREDLAALAALPRTEVI